jgi:hypothetical protein
MLRKTDTRAPLNKFTTTASDQVALHIIKMDPVTEIHYFCLILSCQDLQALRMTPEIYFLSRIVRFFMIMVMFRVRW